MASNRHSFLDECLKDLKESLKLLGNDLIVIKGEYIEVLDQLVKEWEVDLLCFQRSVGRGRERDVKVLEWCASIHLEVELFDPTLYPLNLTMNNLLDHRVFPMNPDDVKIPTTITALQALLSRLGLPPKPLPVPEKLPPPDFSKLPIDSYFNAKEHVHEELKYRGGERAALERMEVSLADIHWVSTFEKPATSPNSLDPSTTVLSPYLAMGCLSVRTLWYTIHQKMEQYCLLKQRDSVTKPPVSLLGQLYWRELFYMNAFRNPKFHLMQGNVHCKQIDWDENEEMVRKWEMSETGYPFIDAIMTQLRNEGWIHHLARHAVACFLTRGDLYQSWEKGAQVFEKYLLDGDYALNNANWQWLSCSNFFYQYFRVYSPTKFGQKTDPTGSYIKKYVPILGKMPSKYIYEPWTAPLSVQETAGCIIGKDYPAPIVDHKEVSKLNISRIKAAYASMSNGQSKKRPSSPESSNHIKRKR